MTDRELLELAAKAAVIPMLQLYPSGGGGEFGWNPLTDDGDALRLAVRLCMVVACYDDNCEVENLNGDMLAFEIDTDVYAATRKAIVRAAAEIGKSL